MASQISGESPTMAITPIDLLLFDFLSHEYNGNYDDLLSNERLLKLFPSVNQQFLDNRVNQLIQGQIIVNDVQSIVNVDAIEMPKVDTIDIDSKYQSATNFAFYRQKGEWVFWSALNQQWYKSDTDAILVLSMFIAGLSQNAIQGHFSTINKGDDIRSILASFVSSGALIKQKAQLTDNKEHGNCVKMNPDFSLTSGLWKQMQPDERIPVYFVPHMKNHYPLALGVLFSALRNHNNGELLKRFQLIPITYMTPGDFLNGPYRKFRQGVWLFSNYMWSLDVNMQISEAIKKQDGRNLTIHGGPSTPEYPQANMDFMNQFSSVDISVHGEGEVAVIEIFDKIVKGQDGKIKFYETLSDVSGISFKDTTGEIIRTVGRKRTATPDFVPSPYLSGDFDDYGAEVDAAILESNRGCPFGCTFCDWGSATNQKVRKFDLERVTQEIDWIANQKVRVLWIADANFGLYDRDIELSQHIVDTKEKTGYPQEVVVNYTKNSTWRLVEIIKIFTAGGIISQGIISIQTTDEQTLEVINRKNIKTEKYDELTKVFYDLKLPLSTDLMMGLPGITVEAFNKDLQRYIDMDVSVKAYPTQLLPNSPMADPEYIEKYKIKTDENDFLISSYSYTEDDLNWMKSMYHMYTIADGYGLMRYVMRYLQWEYQIQAVSFMSSLLKYTNSYPTKYPSITWAVRFFINEKCMPGGWHVFYQQLADFISNEYGVALNSALETVLKVSEASMPDDGVNYPIERNIPHDFTAYFTAKTQRTVNQAKSLDHYPSSRFHVSDPNNMVAIDMNYMQYDSHQYFWELHSDVARPKSTSDFSDSETVTH